MLKNIKWLNTTVEWIKSHNIYSLNFYKNHAVLKRGIVIFVTSFITTILLLLISAYVLIMSYLNRIDRPGRPINVQYSQETDQKFTEANVINVMFYGIDSRDMDEISRSDSIMIVTIDKKNKKIKMTSIARDTRVPIEGHGQDKINHAFAYGWSEAGDIAGGAELSLNTINSVFDLNIKDYVTANFWALAHIIDYLGGVEIDIPESVKNDMNKRYIPHLNQMGISCEPITQSGRQKVTGGQAVAFCRVRYVDGGDVGRGRRQREVMEAMFAKAKDLSPLKYPEFLGLIFDECSTSLSNDEIMSLGTWAIGNFGSLKFENLGLPTEDIEESATINGTWYYTYDLQKATDKIHKFILEQEG